VLHQEPGGKLSSHVSVSRALASNIHKLGIVLPEYGFHRCGCSFFHRMNVLNQLKNVRGHNEQIPRRSGPRIPIRVRNSSRHHYACSRAQLDFLLAHLHAQHTFEHIPGFVVAVMDMRWSNQSPRFGGTTRIAPLGYHEIIVRRAERISSK